MIKCVNLRNVCIRVRFSVMLNLAEGIERERERRGEINFRFILPQVTTTVAADLLAYVNLVHIYTYNEEAISVDVCVRAG